MREPEIATPESLETIPDSPAVFLLWADEGAPYLARTARLKRRLNRLLRDGDGISRVLNLKGVAKRIEYWLTGSQLDATLIHLELARRHFPQDWRRVTRLHPPAFVRLTMDNAFPRTMVTTRLGRGVVFGPFPSRAAAERFDAAVLDLFQIRRCEENLVPSPQHPGCIYGEMNKCLRPCQDAVSVEQYGNEAARLARFLETGGDSLRESAETARDKASADMQFEEAARLHERVECIAQVQSLAGDLGRSLQNLAGVAVMKSVEPHAVELWFMLGGRWHEPRRVCVPEAVSPANMEAGQSLDSLLRATLAGLDADGPPDLEHLSVLIRWHGSTWRDGEWISFESPSKLPYRKMVNAIGRMLQ